MNTRLLIYIAYKLSSLMYKVLSTTQPAYITVCLYDLITFQPNSFICWRSCTNHRHFVQI